MATESEILNNTDSGFEPIFSGECVQFALNEHKWKKTA